MVEIDLGTINVLDYNFFVVFNLFIIILIGICVRHIICKILYLQLTFERSDNDN